MSATQLTLGVGVVVEDYENQPPGWRGLDHTAIQSFLNDLIWNMIKEWSDANPGVLRGDPI